MTLSQNSTLKSFTKFGLTFKYILVTEKRTEWVAVTNRPVDAPDSSNVVMAVNWVPSEKETELTYVDSATFSDDEDCQDLPLSVLSTPDGPILSIMSEEKSEYFILIDPCIVSLNDKTGELRLLPIFNVSRRLVMLKTGVRALTPPSELLLAAYPAFILQNRMGKYQLKTK